MTEVSNKQGQWLRRYRWLLAAGFLSLAGLSLAGLWLAGNGLPRLAQDSWERLAGPSLQSRLTLLEWLLVTENRGATRTRPVLDPLDADLLPESLWPTTVVREGNVAPNQVVEYRPQPVEESRTEAPPVFDVAVVDERIETLLQEADNALAIDRLTTPPEDNAYDRYQKVLSVRPDNARALQGLVQLRQRYLEIVNSAVSKRYYYQVPDLAAKAREIGVNRTELEPLLRGLPGEARRATEEALARVEAEQEKRSRNLVRDTPASAQAAAGEATGETPQVLTAEQLPQDEALAQQAAALMMQQRLSEATDLLEPFVAENPASVASLQQLFTLRLRQGKLDAADKLVRRAEHLPDQDFALMVAQLLARRQDFHGALRALNVHRPGLAEAPAYNALKAAIYYRLGHYQVAAVNYRQLLETAEQEPVFWLGFAVSLDAAGQSGARRAYRMVEQLAPATAAYLPFVQQRLARE